MTDGPSKIAQLIKDYTDPEIKVPLAGYNITKRQRDYEEEARWFVAYKLATDMYDSHTIKDWTHLVRHGCSPINESDLEDYYNEQDAESDLIEEIIEFYKG